LYIERIVPESEWWAEKSSRACSSMLSV
jgi:hypothetical protein